MDKYKNRLTEIINYIFQNDFWQAHKAEIILGIAFTVLGSVLGIFLQSKFDISNKIISSKIDNVSGKLDSSDKKLDESITTTNNILLTVKENNNLLTFQIDQNINKLLVSD